MQKAMSNASSRTAIAKQDYVTTKATAISRVTTQFRRVITTAAFETARTAAPTLCQTLCHSLAFCSVVMLSPALLLPELGCICAIKNAGGINSVRDSRRGRVAMFQAEEDSVCSRPKRTHKCAPFRSLTQDISN